MPDELQLEKVEQALWCEPVAREDRRQRGRIEELRRRVREGRHAAVSEWVPERQHALAERARYKRGDGKVKIAEVPGNNVTAGYEQHAPVEGQDLDEQYGIWPPEATRAHRH